MRRGCVPVHTFFGERELGSNKWLWPDSHAQHSRLEGRNQHIQVRHEHDRVQRVVRYARQPAPHPRHALSASQSKLLSQRNPSTVPQPMYGRGARYAIVLTLKHSSVVLVVIYAYHGARCGGNPNQEVGHTRTRSPPGSPSRAQRPPSPMQHNRYPLEMRWQAPQ